MRGMRACESHAAVTLIWRSEFTASMLDMQRGTAKWSYCFVCRRNHDEGRPHIFTAQHKTALATILGKFSKKVRSARRVLHRPHVVEGELEPGAGVWCYCCRQEVARHVTDKQVSIEWGGLLEHMTSPTHHKRTRHFWWANGAERNQMQTYLLFSAEYKRFKSRVAEVLQQLETTKEERIKKVAEEMRTKEELQSLAAMEPPATPPPPPGPVYRSVVNMYGVLQNPTGWHEGRRVWGGGVVKYKPGSDQLLPWPIDSLDKHLSAASLEQLPGGRFTMAAFAENLTFIAPQTLQVGEGNIHSGATPPWLCEEDSDSEMSAPIGPSLEDFMKHKERLSRLGKNPKRVGADFHQKLARQTLREEEEEEWLPTFGRVWNHGPRSHSLEEFRRELQMERKRVAEVQRAATHKVASTLSTGDTHSSQDVSTPQEPSDPGGGGTTLPHIKPYVRRRPAKHPL